MPKHFDFNCVALGTIIFFSTPYETHPAMVVKIMIRILGSYGHRIQTEQSNPYLY